MDLAETLRPVLQLQAEQLVLAARGSLLHSEGDANRFTWLQRRAIADTLGATVSETTIALSASGASAHAAEHGSTDGPPAPFLRPTLATRIGPLAQAIGAAVSQSVADTLSRRC